MPKGLIQYFTLMPADAALDCQKLDHWNWSRKWQGGKRRGGGEIDTKLKSEKAKSEEEK